MSSPMERANAIRALAMDAVQKANSGHPGAPMGLADVAEVLFRDVLRHNPLHPEWANRDRFVLSNGHSSMLLYAVLHLTGYDLSIEDIKSFRQLKSKTAGHPEYRECPGVETTTGPLGQGFANAVGMALAEKRLAGEFNQPGFPVVDHRTWVIVGDGCLMEGISHEAASFAGAHHLGKLNCIYDDNGISIDGEIGPWFSEDVPARFEAYGWHVIRGVDGHDSDAIAAALGKAALETARPSLICTRTIIGYGAPTKGGTAAAHGSALGEEEVAGVRKRLNWGSAPFEIPEHLQADWNCQEQGSQFQKIWEDLFSDYSQKHPMLAAEFKRRMNNELADGWDADLLELAASAQEDGKGLATRKSSMLCIAELAKRIPEFLGGSADLTGSNLTRWPEAREDQHLSYGVREFAMTAMGNGIALHGGLIPFSGTFLVFMEYARNAVRLAALMKVRNIFVYTHDSVALGEDGPTHQPVEQLTSLRTTPDLSTWRPCDTVESAFAWRSAVASSRPTALIFTRQTTPCQPRNQETYQNIARGGYVLVEPASAPEAIIIATGSEVQLAVDAAQTLATTGIAVRVVSMPCVDVFLSQDAAYQEEVLPSSVAARVAVEAAHPDYWYKFVGLQGAVVGIDRFGLSAPGEVAMAELGMTTDNVVSTVRQVVGGE